MLIPLAGMVTSPWANIRNMKSNIRREVPSSGSRNTAP